MKGDVSVAEDIAYLAKGKHNLLTDSTDILAIVVA